jgi:hypothetical protein
MILVYLNFLGDEDGTEQDTLEFQLKVKCTWNINAPKDSTNPDDIYKDHKSECLCYVSVPVKEPLLIYLLYPLKLGNTVCTKSRRTCEILGSHFHDYEDFSFVRFDAVKFLKMKAVCLCKMLVSHPSRQ